MLLLREFYILFSTKVLPEMRRTGTLDCFSDNQTEKNKRGRTAREW